tara:strand:- start:10328 stop:10633 length:306 start_codon:yes stop_codon:yes gene_type:complete
MKLIVEKGVPTSRLVLPYSESQLPNRLLTTLKNEFEQISFCFDITIAIKMVEADCGVDILPMSEINCIKDIRNFSYVETLHCTPSRPIYITHALPLRMRSY